VAGWAMGAPEKFSGPRITYPEQRNKYTEI